MFIQSCFKNVIFTYCVLNIEVTSVINFIYHSGLNKNLSDNYEITTLMKNMLMCNKIKHLRPPSILQGFDRQNTIAEIKFTKLELLHICIMSILVNASSR